MKYIEIFLVITAVGAIALGLVSIGYVLIDSIKERIKDANK